MERDYSGFVSESSDTKVEPTEEPKVEESGTPEAQLTNEGNDTTPTNSEEEPKPVEEPKPREKSRAQKRIETLSKEKRELQREIEELKSQSAKVNPKDELDPDDFDDYDEYLEAVKKQKKPKAQEKNVPESDPIADFRDELESKFDDGRDAHADFDEKIRAMPILTVEMLQAINDSDEAASVAYYLAENPAEAARLSGMTVRKIAIEIGKIEVKLQTPTKEKQPPAKKVTAAPEPITPLSGVNGKAKSLNEAADYGEYESMRNAQSSKKTGWA